MVICREAVSERHYPFVSRSVQERGFTTEGCNGSKGPIERWSGQDTASPDRKEPGMTGSGEGEFERVILPHLDAAYNLARWLVGDPTLAEDVVQDAVLRALRYFTSFRGGNGRAWIFRIVRNTAHEHLKGRRAGAEVSLGSGTDQADIMGVGMDIPDPGPDPETQYAELQGRERLASVLAALPIEQRECLVLCELEELSYKDIARITQVPIGTVMSRLSRARSALMRIPLVRMPQGEREPAPA
jgi:RNA polymerase sigma-70 factor (ECF subfamily)